MASHGSGAHNVVHPTVHTPFSPTTAGGDARHTTQPGLPEAIGEDLWQPDSEAKHCHQCQSDFGFFSNRRHHCRKCGFIFCAACTSHALDMQESVTGELLKERRVCDPCYREFYAMFDMKPPGMPDSPAPAGTGAAAKSA